MTTPVALGDDAWAGVEPGTEALVDRWQASEGERVHAGQVLAVVVLVKTSIDVPAPVDGVLERILVPAGDTFARGAPIATLRDAV